MPDHRHCHLHFAKKNHRRHCLLNRTTNVANQAPSSSEVLLPETSLHDGIAVLGGYLLSKVDLRKFMDVKKSFPVLDAGGFD